MLLRTFLLLSLDALALASPLLPHKSASKLPLSRQINLSSGKTIPQVDQERFKALKASVAPKPKGRPSAFDATISNGAVVYTADVGVGNQTFTLIVDVGSSNTWVGANASNPYIPTNTSTSTDTIIFIEYGSGLFAGLEYFDSVTLGDLVVTNQSIGAAQFALGGFEGLDGILGLGPEDLTESTTASGQSIPTITDNAFEQGLIDAYEVGIFFAPPTIDDEPNGEVTIGGVDASKFNGSLTYVNLTTTFPASEYVGINQSVAYGAESTDVTTLLANSAGFVDTGTTLLTIASDAFALYQNLTGAVLDDTTGLLTITPEQEDNLQSLFFTIGGETFEFTKNAQIFPRILNTDIGGDPNSTYLIVGNLGSPSGIGLDFINGYGFLERFYSVYDTGNSRVGFAQTPFTYATTN